MSAGTCLPLARVKTIMKSSPDVEAVTQETLFVITRATVNWLICTFFMVDLICKVNFSGAFYHVPDETSPKKWRG